MNNSNNNNSKYDTDINLLGKKTEREKNVIFNVNKNRLKYFSRLVPDCKSRFSYYNTFLIFKSIEDKYYLLYLSNNNYFACYDLIYREISAEVPISRDNYLTNIQHFYDKINNRDLILGISSIFNDLKVWDFSNWKCITFISRFNFGISLSGFMMEINNQVNIIISNRYVAPIKIFDLNGIKIKEINDSKGDIIFIDKYYEKKNDTNYIISISESPNYVKSFNIDKNELYYTYISKEKGITSGVIIYEFEGITRLIVAEESGDITILNFHSGEILRQINENILVNCICLWKENEILIGDKENKLILLNLETKNIVKISDTKLINSIKKFELPDLGECLFTQEKNDINLLTISQK